MNFHHEQEKSFTSGLCCLINCCIKVMFSGTEFHPACTTGQHRSWLFSRPRAHENHSDSLTEKTDEAENQSMIHYQSENKTRADELSTCAGLLWHCPVKMSQVLLRHLFPFPAFSSIYCIPNIWRCRAFVYPICVKLKNLWYEHTSGSKDQVWSLQQQTFTPKPV